MGAQKVEDEVRGAATVWFANVRLLDVLAQKTSDRVRVGNV
jgi:hypothetical protein